MATFYIYKDSAGGYRWRLKSSNGRIIADSGESYVEKSGAKWGEEWVRVNAKSANEVDLTQ